MKGKHLVVAVAVLAAAVAVPARAQIEITSKDGNSSLKFGLLTQLQAQSFEDANGDHAVKDLYVRRLRVLMGGKLGDKISFFLETDSPNLGLRNATGGKTSSDVYIQDLIVTYTFSQEFHLDAGLILTPNSYNSEQSAAALLPVDYGPYSFLASAPTGSNVGRDYGLQARGYLGKNHFEYRFGIYQGDRSRATMPFRYISRVVWYPFEAQTGYFYTGTTHGKKKIVGVGASWDHQDKYDAYGGDVFVDWPVNGGDGITFQTDFLRYDGGTTFTSLPKQDATLVELAYYFHNAKMSPFAQYATRNYSASTSDDEKKWQVGVAYWPRGHNFNLKLGAGQVEKDNHASRQLVQLQLQFFVF